MTADQTHLDIAEELEARGDDLSRRAARYIRLKRNMLAGVSDAYHRLCAKTVEDERCQTP